MKQLSTIIVFLFIQSSLFSQSSIAACNSTVTQAFTGFAPAIGTNISTTPLTNWVLTGTGTGGQIFQGTNQSGGTSGGWYANQNLSFLGSGSASNGQATWSLQNNTGSDITSFSLSLFARMFKSGTASPTVSVSWQAGACGSNPTIGALSNSLSSLGFSDVTTNISPTGATLSQTASAISIPAGSCIYIRFIFSGGSSSDNLGIDNLNFTVNTCTSSVCSLLSSGLIVGACNDAGTLGGNTADDYFKFTLNPTGSTLGASYTAAGSFTGSPVSGIAYGSNQTIGGNQLISAGAFNVTITDVANPACKLIFTVTPPTTCSADPPSNPVTLLTQSVNPCGGDGQNEFIVASTGTAGINIADLAFSSDNNGDVNYWWYGSNVPMNAYNISGGFASGTYETCGLSGTGFECAGFLYPSNSGQNTTINDRIAQLNGCLPSGCVVFLPVPSTNIIPANSQFIVFLGAGNCDFDAVCTNLNFSNHCSAGVATQTYYAVFGQGAGGSGGCASTSGGYFNNGTPRTSTLIVYDGSGSNTTIANYFVSETTYAPGAGPTAGNGGFINPAGTWINDQGCVPPAAALIFPLNFLSFNVQKINTKNIRLVWTTAMESQIKGYFIERSVDGVDFKTIGYKSPTNILYKTNQYDVVDSDLDGGVYYYRIRVEEMGGAVHYSPIRVVSLTNLQKITLFPTVTTGKMTLISEKPFAQNIQYAIFDYTGKIVHSGVLAKDALSQELNVSSLIPGIYILNIQNNQYKDLIRFLKQQ